MNVDVPKLKTLAAKVVQTIAVQRLPENTLCEQFLSIECNAVRGRDMNVQELGAEPGNLLRFVAIRIRRAGRTHIETVRSGMPDFRPALVARRKGKLRGIGCPPSLRRSA